MNLGKTSNWEWEYRRKQNEAQIQLIKDMDAGKVDPDIYALKSILLSIAPYSKWWR